jgi:hypothetical protein
MCFAFEKWKPNSGLDGWQTMRFNVISGDVTLQLCMYVSPITLALMSHLVQCGIC